MEAANTKIFIIEILYHKIPNQLIRRYTKENKVVLEHFVSSGTTLFECEKLHRKYASFDIKADIIKYVNDIMINSMQEDFSINCLNFTDKQQVDFSLLNIF